MKLHLTTAENNNLITGYGEDFIEINRKRHSKALIVLANQLILDWDASYAAKFPFKLFELHRQYTQEGLFDAYNQWVFATSQNLPAYQTWTNAHSQEHAALNRFLQDRIFKVPAGQYYH